jgi:hypothetical protein
VGAGNDLPGVPRRTAYAELAWRPAATGWRQVWVQGDQARRLDTLARSF